MKSHKTTVKDVAAYVGVSQATVSRVLAGYKGISDETRALVLDACKKLNYVPNAAARMLTGQSTKMIGMIVPDISNPYFSGIFASVERTATKYGYHVLLANSMRDPSLELKSVENFVSRRIDGFIISPISAASQLETQKLVGSVPAVYLGANHSDDVSSVEPDNEQMAYMATKYLLDTGHRHIVFLGGRISSNSRNARIVGYRRAMNEYGIIHILDYPSPDSAGDMTTWAPEAVKKILNEQHPDALLCFNDMVALRALSVTSELNIRVPEDLSIMGIDNISFSALPRLNLSTVTQSKTIQGSIAVDRLMEKINGNSSKTTDILQPKLILRGTCCDRTKKD